MTSPLAGFQQPKGMVSPSLLAAASLPGGYRLIAISRYVADQLVAFGVKRIESRFRTESHPSYPVLAPFRKTLALARHDAKKPAGVVSRVACCNASAPVAWCLADSRSRWSPDWSAQRLHRQLPRPEQVELIEGLPRISWCVCSSLALLSASTEEGFDYPVLEAKAEGIPTLISAIPVHREFHAESSLFFPVDDDGTTLARHLIDLRRDRALWDDLSQRGLALARSLSVERQVEAISAQIRALQEA